MPYIRVQDAIDIIIITVLVYQLYRWFRNTRALQVVIGLVFLGCLYLVTKSLGLFMTSWILQELGTVLFVLIIVVFQAEIRQALYRVSLLRHAIGRQVQEPQLDLRELADTVFTLASTRTGALIVLQQRESLDDFLQHGSPIDSVVSSALLYSIFNDGSPLHDGAVVIAEGRIKLASCHLPLATQSELPVGCGTRHRAALGLSERSDAIIIVVSEERGTVSLAEGQELRILASVNEMQEKLAELLALKVDSASGFIKQGRVHDLRTKVAVLVMVLISWLILTTKQGEIITVSAPVRFKNLPDKFSLQTNVPEELDVQLKVLSSLIPSPKQLDVVAEIDLANVHEGINQVAMRNEDIKLPVGVKITQVKPNTVKVTVARKVRKQLPLRVVTTGSLPGRLHVKRQLTEPAIITVEGAEQTLNHIHSLPLEEIDLSRISQSAVLERSALTPSPQVKVIGSSIIKVRLVVGN